MATSSFIPDQTPTVQPENSFVPDDAPSSPVTVKPDDAWKAAVHSRILGTTPGYAYQNGQEIDKQLRQRAPDYDTGELDPTILNDIKVGYEESIFGLKSRGKLPEQVRDPGMVDRLVSGISQMVSDVPFMAAGAVAGGFAGSEVPVVGTAIGAAAGAFAVPAGVREALVTGIKNGEVKDFKDLMYRAADVTWAATKGAITGAATELAGGIPVGSLIAKSGLASLAMKGLYQATALTTTADLLEGKLPSAGDFAGNAALIVPLNLITHGLAMRGGETKQALMDVYAKDGTTPAEMTDKLNAQPPVKPDQPPGLRVAVKVGDGVIEGNDGETHPELAERLGQKPVDLDSLNADPSLADKVLQEPETHLQEVIDRAWALKKDEIESGNLPENMPERSKSASRFFPLELKPPVFDDLSQLGEEKYAQLLGEAPTQEIPRDKIVGTQTDIFKRGVVDETTRPEMRPKSRPVVFIKQGEEYLIADGHHAAIARILQGKPIEGKVIDANDIPGERMATLANERIPREENPISIDELYNRGEMKSGRGFVTPNGDYLSREQARSWSKENEPEVEEMWQKIAGDPKSELHADDYAQARERVAARNVAEGEQALAQASPQLRKFLATNRTELNEIKAGNTSERYGNTVIRDLFVGPRNMLRASTEQLVGRLRKILPNHLEQESLSFMRDYRDNLDLLRSTMQEIDAGKNENLRAFLPAMEKALNPSPQMLQADQALTDHFTKTLDMARQLQLFDSSIDPSRYSPRLFMKAVEDSQEAKRVGRPAFTQKTPHGIQRDYRNILDPLKTGKVDARTVNAIDSLSIYGDRFATAASTKIFGMELKNSALGVQGTAESHPEGWEELKGSGGLYVPKVITDAMEPLLRPGGLPSAIASAVRAQSYMKAIELSLSMFHMKAMTITAMNNQSFADFTRSLASDNNSPKFEAQEREGSLWGLETTKTGPAYEAYKGLKPSSLPTGLDKLANIPVIKQVDEFAQGITRQTFDVVQRKFKVMDFSQKQARWIAKNPEATDIEYGKAMRGIAKEVNAAYGGLNWDVLGVSKGARDIARMFILAPDWTFSNVLNLKYSGEGGPAGTAARSFWVKSFVTGIALSQATSVALTGQVSDKWTQVYLGTDKEGKKMYSPWFFAGAPKDAVTMVNQIVNNGLLGGFVNFTANKLGPILGTGARIYSNKDFTGKAITKPGEGPVQKTGEQAAFAAKQVIPFSAGNLAESIKTVLTETDKNYTYSEFLEVVSNAIGSSVIHANPPKGGQPAKAEKVPGEKSPIGIPRRQKRIKGER